MRPAASRHRVLVIAYACNPTQGSEEGVGWSWVMEIAKRHDVDVVTAAFHREAIERALSGRRGTGVPRFHYVAPSWWHYRPSRVWKRIEASPLKFVMNLAYVGWQRNALALCRRLLAERPFDLVHLLTYVGFRFPGRFHTLGKPFVWGPVGGLENTPTRLLPIMGAYGAAYYAVRNAVNTVQKIALGAPRIAMRTAGQGAIAATSGVQKEIRRVYGIDATVISEIGLPDAEGVLPPVREAGEPLRLVWSGQHLPGKALNLLLAACARIPKDAAWHLDVLGDGPRRSAWERDARRRGIADCVTWHGWVPREAARSVMRTAHVLVMTSLKDLTSTVVLEALSLGVPVICLDHCGFADVVTDACGIKVSPTDRERIVEGLANAIRALDVDEPRRRRLGEGARVRAGNYAFAGKMAVLDRIYASKVRADPTRADAGVDRVGRLPRSAVRLVGSEVDLVTIEAAVDTVGRWIERRDGRCRQIVVTGFHGLWEGARDAEFRRVLGASDLWIPDGIAPVWMARMRGHRRAVRVPGAELMAGVMARGNTSGWRSFFYGDTPETLDALEQAAVARWPGHIVAGTLSPPFRPLSEAEETEHLEIIRRARPDILWVGLGLPKQEQWIHRVRDRLDAPVVIGVGAAFGFLAGTVERAPAWIGMAGFEWAWRLLREPQKTWRRSLLDGPRFLVAVLLEVLGVCEYEYGLRGGDDRLPDDRSESS